MTVTINGTSGITAPGTETFGDGTALGGATNPIVSMAKGANNYVQGYIVNNTDAANSSADLVCYPSNGTDSSGWIDMGITGPTFSQAAYGITGQNEGYIFMSAPSGASKTGNLVLATDSTGTQNAIKFATGGFGSTTERMRLDASGNLGVGTTSPQSRLHVNTPTISSATLRELIVESQSTGAGNTLGSLVGVTFSQSSTAYAGGGLLRTSGVYGVSTDNSNFSRSLGLAFYTSAQDSAAVERARIDSSGNLLVGKTASLASSVGIENRPDGQIYAGMAGSTGAATTLNVYSTGAAAYRFYVGMDGRVNATLTTISAISDERLKENIRDLDLGLTDILALKPRRYDWKEGKGADIKNAVGFIAQEFETVFPTSVGSSKAGEDGIEYKNICHEELIPTLVKAIQEQQAIIESLTTRITALEKA